jgi:hypothetical protein
VLDTARDDEEFTWRQLDDTIAELDTKPAADGQEQLVFVLVVMPHELAPELHELHFLPIQRTDDLGPPVVMNECEFLSEVDLVH